jgi:hypothetical protein
MVFLWALAVGCCARPVGAAPASSTISSRWSCGRVHAGQGSKLLHSRRSNVKGSEFVVLDCGVERLWLGSISFSWERISGSLVLAAAFDGRRATPPTLVVDHGCFRPADASYVQAPGCHANKVASLLQHGKLPVVCSKW